MEAVTLLPGTDRPQLRAADPFQSSQDFFVLAVVAFLA